MITGKQVLTSSGWAEMQSVHVDGHHINAINDVPDNTTADCHYLVPGFIDVQVNGGGGVLLNQSCSPAAIARLTRAHLAYGTTAMMPTLITDSMQVMADAAKAIREARQEGNPSVIGVHFEGPWLSLARKGVHKADFIRPPTDAELQILTDNSLGTVMVTLAAETASVEVIRALTQAGIKVFLGHSDAPAEVVNLAIEAGATGFTHLYNAMSQMQSRAPGMVGAALASTHTYAGIIVDNYHVDPLCCQVAFNAKGRDRMMLVTDAMALAATDETRVPFFDTHIERHGDKLTTPDGTLAGSCLTMIQAVKNAVNTCNVTLEDAVIMASRTPASMLGVGDTMGQIAPGYRADMVGLDEDLNITHLWQNGQAMSV